MLMVDDEREKAASSATLRAMQYLLLLLLIPFLGVLCIYLTDNVPLLASVAARYQDVPVTYTSQYPQLSAVMDLYAKTAPVPAVIFFLFACRGMYLVNKKDLLSLVGTFLGATILLLVIYYFFIFYSVDLSESGCSGLLNLAT